MPPKIHLIRHAQGEHNTTRDYSIRDAVLTAKEKEQCRMLSENFEPHAEVDIIFASPLRRTIQTAALSFGPTLSKKIDMGTADSAEDLEQALPEFFAEDSLDFDLMKIDASKVTTGWNTKGYWAYEKPAISKRAADCRNWLFQRCEAQAVVITHGLMAHFLTEDWDVEDPMIGTAYKNCEHREFVFTSESTSEDAHVTETEQSRARRGPNGPKSDPHVLDEMKTLKDAAKKEKCYRDASE
ncbi:hypothetical protein BDU57DRAFT_560498 [Ampelomyces quisqualis]|uniref:Histidine phosphatase superfamily n=1 Tax=Ampelomyces quisqualis TaxID=50730 RepID=A0A6A5Q7F4_AMPQU|nr:hypothetical protein BDU57DRAFT_560498 [Ampelomyces quisqualis]